MILISTGLLLKCHYHLGRVINDAWETRVSSRNMDAVKLLPLGSWSEQCLWPRSSGTLNKYNVLLHSYMHVVFVSGLLHTRSAALIKLWPICVMNCTSSLSVTHTNSLQFSFMLLTEAVNGL